MKKLISEYMDSRGKVEINKIKGHTIVFNFKGKPELLEKKVVDAFEGYVKFLKEWVKLADISIHFVIEEDELNTHKTTIKNRYESALRDIIKEDTRKDVPSPNVPFFPQKFPVRPFNDNKYSCSKCGLECKGVMGYCCPNYDCPMGMGGTWCHSTSYTY